MEPTKSIFELNLTIYYTYLCTKFGVNRIEIATSSVDTYTHTRTDTHTRAQTHTHAHRHTHIYTYTHTENLFSCEIGGEISLPVIFLRLFV